VHNYSKKNQAITLRHQGKSLLQISKELHIAKSTASLWLRTEKNQGMYARFSKKEWMKHILDLSHKSVQLRLQHKKQLFKQLSKKEVSSLPNSQEFRKSILSILYWAEGTKVYGGVTFANTDPQLCMLFITNLRLCYKINEEKLRLRIHLQKQHNKEVEELFWSDLLQIPKSQFNKTIWKKTVNTENRYRKNYHGICFIKYNSVDLQQEIMTFAYTLGARYSKHSQGL
jgi:hypothetical protein